ncbi:MAG TPA: methyl-accepting chemotaxis protein [Myxococcales bacterium]|jgi:methyl-accepting chemotaxis protein
MAEQLYGARQDFLINIHTQVWKAASRALLPVVVLSYTVHLFKSPCWQTITLFVGSLGLVAAWFFGTRLAGRGDLKAAVTLCAGSGIAMSLLVLVLRENSATTCSIAILALFTYVALFSDRALFVAVAVSTPLYVAGLAVGFFQLVPQYSQGNRAAVIQIVAFAVIFFPVAAYFLRAGQRINEALFLENLESSAHKDQLLEAVAKVQPVLDQAIAGIRPMAEAFAATASQQAATSSEMGATAQRVAQMVGETASAAKGTREATEKIRDDAAQGREKLRDVEGRFEAAVKRIESVRRQIDELAAEVAKTEEVNRAIHEIAKNLTVMGINATLEAARAGEAGVGFKVVAGELQRLVGQTTADLHQANQILEHLRARAAVIAQDTDASTGDLRASYERLVAVSGLLEGITSSFEGATRSVEGIAGAAEQQRAGIGEISAGIHDMVDVAGRLSEAGRGLREGLERVEGAHGQLREILAKQ